MEMATTPDNAPSRALAARLGFIEEGLQRKRNLERGVRVDLVVFGLLARDWRLSRRIAA
jgi:RimJ/RimL family protein N-acetyltransferase